jgi:hypothetical protein
MTEFAWAAVAFAAVLIAVAIGATIYNVRELDYRRVAIEHGCSIDSRQVVICAAGDRR